MDSRADRNRPLETKGDVLSAEEIEEIEEEEREEQAIEDAGGLAPKLLFEVIRRDGEEELSRPRRSLVYAGIAAGMMISMSVVGEAIFRTYLPDVPWRYLIENLGYSLGFLVVILGRMQLFTENTITTVLPVIARPSRYIFGMMLRLWGIVLAANVVGAFAIGAFYRFTPALAPELWPAMDELSRHATGFPPLEGFFRAIPAGVLVAALVWMMPQREGGRFAIILAFTWLIAAGDFTHVVAGSVEWAWLVWGGHLGFFEGFATFFLPVLLGNIVGGTAIFTLLAHGQVKDELDRRPLVRDGTRRAKRR
ncbi:formate/nitrite transporter family protein [Jannaschia aquimarina]|uniref:YfdC protein n=1 Tax=Jannaschia aquimarina TaxID=935700 RepID=A0A0D1CKU8_9RHOB|nr:formate/nitrite transporter family protein [Jannaschia aquimarina]KIT15407.1 Inner membrane protein YfdC [Jannaschia aquimarina]SNT22751.1 Formate/nitrite transporter FocA, FNT family [Jannaschia aquimarina]